jgi:hypothetical protein
MNALLRRKRQAQGAKRSRVRHNAAPGAFGSNPEGTSAMGRHSSLRFSRRRPVFASEFVNIGALIDAPWRSFAFADIA